MSTDVLRDRDTNLRPAVEQRDTMAKEQPKSMEFHRQVLEQKMKNNDDDKSNYISPSDAIMSPASQKLSSFKQRQMNKSIPKSRSLFAKAMSSREKDLGPVRDENKTL